MQAGPRQDGMVRRSQGINATGELDDQTLSALGVRTGSATAGRSGSERPAE